MSKKRRFNILSYHINLASLFILIRKCPFCGQVNYICNVFKWHLLESHTVSKIIDFVLLAGLFRHVSVCVRVCVSKGAKLLILSCLDLEDVHPNHTSS